MSKQLQDVVENKARRMLGNPEWVNYGQSFAKELGLEKAFQAGAIDAMIFDMASAIGERIPSRDDRKKLIKKLLGSP